MPSLFLLLQSGIASADTLHLKNGKDLKGLIVEEHADRIVLSTEKGELPILRSGIKSIEYDDEAQNFYQAAKAYEEEKKLGEALAYYEKAVAINPNFEEAKKASIGVRNKLWATSTEGPIQEIEKQQTLYDDWGQGRPSDERAKKETLEDSRALREGMGVSLEEKGEWVRLSFVDSKKGGSLAGLKKNDRLVAIDGNSLRYLSPAVIARKMLAPRHSSFTLEVERDCFLRKPQARIPLKKLGLKLVLEYRGVVVRSTESGSLAEEAGLKPEDLVVRVDGVSTRYLPLKKLTKIIEGSSSDRVVFTVQRSALLSRG